MITGSGTYALPGFAESREQSVETPWGAAQVTRGELAGVEVLHISRHGTGHIRLSNHVEHRANVWAMRELGAELAIGATACGAVDASVPLGSLIVFDDLHFLSNRLPGGEICTLFDQAGDPSRAHWIIGDVYCAEVRRALVQGARQAGHTVRDGGVYGHVDGPRFNTRTEIAQLAGAGVTAVSQTGGPETTLMGEAEIPYALVGFATDYANGVSTEATPVEHLIDLMSRSTGVFAGMLAAALPALAGSAPQAPGTVYRFGS